MNYYHLSFGYPGPFSFCAEGVEENKALWDAESLAIEALKKLELNSKHAYAWPDGSLYKYVRSEKSLDEIREMVNRELSEDVKLCGISEADPNENPYKAGAATLEEYFKIDDEMPDISSVIVDSITSD